MALHEAKYVLTVTAEEGEFEDFFAAVHDIILDGFPTVDDDEGEEIEVNVSLSGQKGPSAG